MAGCSRFADWGDEKLRSQMSALKLEELVAVTLEDSQCRGEPESVSRETASELIAHIASLRVATDIGKREPWLDLRTLKVKTASGRSFRISIGTRESLGPLLIVGIEEEPSGGIGFYSGEGFWKWLRGTPEFLALEGRSMNGLCS